MNDKRYRLTAEHPAAISRRLAVRRVGVGGLAAGLLIGSSSGEASAQSSLTSAATEAAARRAINAINQALKIGDMTVLDLAFAPDYVNHTPPRSRQSGQLVSPDLAGLEAALVELRTAVPDAVIVVDDILASGDTAAIRATFRGTIDPAAGPLPEGVSGRLTIGGAAFFRVADGLVVESWDYNEAAALAGAVATPTPEPTPEPEPEPTEAPVAGGEARDVSNFNAVSLQGVGTLLIEQGDTESLTIEAEEKVLRRIDTEVRRGVLTISPARSFTTRDPIIYHLAVKDLTAIELSGSGAVEAGELTSDQLQLNLAGAGSITIDQLTANTLEITANGNGAVTLAGDVDQQTVTLGEAASYDGADLVTRETSISVGGAAQAVVNATESLTAQVSGAGKLQYRGNPEVRQDVSAAGSITQIG